MDMQAQARQDEQTHLDETLVIVTSERQKAERGLGIVDGNDRLIHVMDDGSDDALVAQFVVRSKLRALHQLRLSEKQPYFAHLDFTPDLGAPVLAGLCAGEKSPVYIGRWGVLQTPEYRLCVADWRSPVANLYYSGQVGRVSYDAPDGRVEGELSLKRMLTVADGKLLSMQDTGVVGQEKFLTDALSQVTTARLREVVTTIQAEQNTVIRYNPILPLCVQGVAGSGKTTIALHRIAWILYRLQKTVGTQQLLILAPNPLFLSYISRVLPDLGVDDVRQLTFAGLCEKLLSKRMPKLWQSARLSERLEMTKPERDALDDILKRKGALSLRAELARFLAQWEQSCLPKEALMLGSRVILSTDEMKRYFLVEFRHFPLLARIGELRKVASARLKRATDELIQALQKLVEEKLDALLHSLPDGPLRREQAKKLFDARDERLAQMKLLSKALLKSYDALWGSMDLLTVYAAFWRGMAERDAQNQAVLDATLPVLAKKRVAPEDLPAVLLLAKGLYGLAPLDIRHVVIDEAQDVSPLQIKALRELFGHDAFTLVGDLCQGIYGDEGLRSWDDLALGIFDTPPHVARLSTAYRSTVEIMEAAFSVLSRHPVAGAGTAKPVLRHGQSPTLTQVSSDAERVRAAVDIVNGWLSEGFSGIAVIVKTERAAKALHAAMVHAGLNARHITQGDDAFLGGVQVMDASVVKGLEFDCVLIADADEKTYPDERFYAKLFYVLLTRPLHRLRLLCVGAGTRLWGEGDA
ncbi:MAG: AAA family ATPase [Clostridia bacterium]